MIRMVQEQSKAEPHGEYGLPQSLTLLLTCSTVNGAMTAINSDSLVHGGGVRFSAPSLTGGWLMAGTGYCVVSS